MGKTEESFKEIKKEEDKRVLLRTKTTEGTIGFGKLTINRIITDADELRMFNDFFDKREILAKKIDKALREAGLLLWERDNIF